MPAAAKRYLSRLVNFAAHWQEDRQRSRTHRSARLRRTGPKASFQYKTAGLRAISLTVSITQHGPLSRRSRSDWLEGVVDRVRVDAVSEGGGRGSKISPGRHLLHGDCENLKPGVQGAERSTSMWHRGPVARASLPSPVSRLTSNASASATYEAS